MYSSQADKIHKKNVSKAINEIREMTRSPNMEIEEEEKLPCNQTFTSQQHQFNPRTDPDSQIFYASTIGKVF